MPGQSLRSAIYDSIVRHQYPSGVLGELEMMRRGPRIGSANDPAQLEVSRALAEATFYVDADTIGVDGRPLIDFTGAKNIRLSEHGEPITTGELMLLNGARPPPPIIERLSGCCLNGRPAGKRSKIMGALKAHEVSSSNTQFLSMVVDRGTAAVIRASPVLTRVSTGQKPINRDWGEFVSEAMRANTGKNLILLTHVVGDSAVVEGPRGESLFSIPLAELHDAAARHGTTLILLGCETSTKLDRADATVGVIGSFKTTEAARAIGRTLAQPHDGASFLEAIATRDMMIVAQPGSWSPSSTGASYYARTAGKVRNYVRVLRVWFLGRDHGTR